ncbi:transposase [Streptomyces nojiriensis]|uniref:transposase n=1 Tax=Streptomyces nojiriensis TaxID=66374 RepID=UPI00365094FA
MGFSTVLRFAHAAEPAQLFTGQWQSRPTKLDAFKPYLDQRWQEGCTNAWKLWEEIKAQGYPDGYGNVRAYVSRNLRGRPQPVGPRPPSARAVTRWILAHPEVLTESDRLQLKAVLSNCPELDALVGHVRSFARMLTQLQGHQLPAWIETATTADLPGPQRFARHLERDLDAVIAGLSMPWNSGVVEGHVNWIKMLKRQMFGRAGFELLRKRVLLYS